jgi:hypothetical protein
MQKLLSRYLWQKTEFLISCVGYLEAKMEVAKENHQHVKQIII